MLETTTRHPARHPKVEPLFGDVPPMTKEDLDELLREMEDAEFAHGGL